MATTVFFDSKRNKLVTETDVDVDTLKGAELSGGMKTLMVGKYADSVACNGVSIRVGLNVMTSDDKTCGYTAKLKAAGFRKVGREIVAIETAAQAS